jgi:uncharacterized protein YjdB
VDGNGLVTAIGAGSATITATSESKTGTSSITVTPAPVTSVTLSAPTTPMMLRETQPLTATTKNAAGATLTGRTVSWVSSDSTVVKVTPAGGPSGTAVTVTAVGLGTATITATSETAPSATTPSITVIPVPVATVAVTPASATLVLGITPSQQLSAVTKDASGNALTGRLVTWSSSNEAAATVDGNGLVTAVSPGTTTITATSETKTGTSSITVTVAPVATVTVSPTSASLFVGATQQLAVALHDAANNELTSRAVTWSSDNTAVATVDANGLVTAVSAGGPVTITATSETKIGTSSITVTLVPVATVAVTPSSATLVLGITPTQKLTAVTTDANDHVVTDRLVTWSSSSQATATVDANGLVTAVAPGSTTITATSETKTGTSAVTVIVAPVATVTVSPPATPMADRETQQLTAVTRDANNNVLTGRLVTWSSSNPGIATVDAGSGVVTGVSTGTIQITASSEGKSATASITVIARVASVVISPESSSLETGNTLELSVMLRDLLGYELTRPVTWSSANPNIASVDPTSGLVTAEGVGSVTITATSETKTGTATVSVRAPTPPPITLTNEPPGMTLVSERPFNSLAEDTTWLLGGFSLIQDGTAPKSPPGVLRATYPAGFDGGSSPGYAERALTESRALYISYWAKLSSNFYGHGTGVNKQVYAWANGNPVFYFHTEGAGTGSLYPSVVQQNTPADAVYSPNLVPAATVPRGQWYQVEIVLNGNSAEAADGSVDWWLNGVHVGSVSGIRWTTEATSWQLFSLRPIWGGVGGAVPATMTLDFDHVYVSARPRVTAVTVTPSSATLVLGVTPNQQLTAVTTDSNGNVLTGRLVTWSSSDETAATVDADGLVTAVGPGSTTITATSETKTGTSAITVIAQ